MKPIVIFYHAYIPNSLDIFNDQINELKQSKIINFCKEIHINYWCPTITFESDDNKIIYHKNNIEFNSEYSTIKMCYDYCKKYDCYVLYIHTKSASRLSKQTTSWRKYMEYFNIVLWKDAINILEKYDTYGVDLHKSPMRHYSGNFWWATSNHIKNLPEPNPNDRMLQEFWVASQGDCYCAHESNIDLYYNIYNENIYKKINNMKVLYIAAGNYPDYLCDCVLHGLYMLLGSGLTHTGDAYYMYKDKITEKNRQTLYGSGFTLYATLPKYINDNTNIEDKIINHYFDFIIYGSVFRNMDYYDLVLKHYSTHEIAVMDGEDFNAISKLDKFPESVLFFKRELQQTTRKNVHPISFSIPEEKITSIENIIKIQKESFVKPRLFGENIYGDTTNYIYTKEEDYYKDYQQSFFGLTHKKAGWDCLRHYEILANFCVPYFPDIDDCPKNTMVNFPKDIIKQTNNLYLKNKFGTEEYYKLLHQLFNYTKEKLTTINSAKYILNLLIEHKKNEKNNIIEHFYNTIQGWFDYEELFSNQVKIANDNSHFVEVGIWKGRSSAYLAVEILNSKKNIKYDCVDTWDGSEEHIDPNSPIFEKNIIDNKDWLYNTYLKNLENVRHIINPIRLASIEAAKLYDDDSLDFVFIDASHEYENIKADILAWYPKIKNGGYFGGHDYWHIPISKAVNEILKDKNISSLGTSWFIQK